MSKDILSDKHIHEIGRLVVHVSRLDSLMTDLISVFSDAHILHTMIMVHHQQFANKVDTLLAVMRAALADFDEIKFQQLIEPINKAKAVADFRNTLVHALWSIQPDGIVLAVRFQARGELKRSRLPVSAQDIREQADKAAALVVELSKMRDHMHQQANPPAKQAEED